MRDTPEENAGREAGHKAEGAAEEASPWADRLARFGYVTKGAVYAVVGVLAIGVATGTGGRTVGPRGAFGTIYAEPFGRFLLGFVAVGLAGYALWRLFQGIADPDGEGRGARGIARRTGHGAAAIGYSALSFTAGRMAITASEGSSPKGWAAWLLSQPLGWALAAGIGFGVVGYGLNQLYHAYDADFRGYLRLGQISDRTETWVTRLGRFGLAARGVVFGLIGAFLILAALQLDPNEAGNLGGALQTLLRQPFGSWLLGFVASGLIAYGLLMFTMARYARIAPGRAF